MQRVGYQRNGGPEVLELDTVEPPTPGVGELLIRVDAVGVTLPTVRTVRENPAPRPLAADIAGEVVAVGDGVLDYSPGYRVTGLCLDHAYAQYALLPASAASTIPDGISAVDAAALVRGGLVALGALDAARAAAGETALITAAAGGVGHLAVQLARIRGAEWVVGAVSDSDKAAFLTDLGADEVITYDQTSWGRPAHYGLEAVGGDQLTSALAALAAGGRLVAYGSGDALVSTVDLRTSGKSLIGFGLRRSAQDDPQRMDQWRQELWQYYASGLVRPAVHAEFGLHEAAQAHAELEARRNLGKVVLIP